METKQTAVEWLINKINSDNYQKAFGQTYISVELIEQAKQIEKEQIINAFGEKRQFIGFDDNECFGIKEVSGEEYYNETYGKEES